MVALRTLALIMVILILSTNTFANDPFANEILKKVAAKYKTLKTYKAKGTITNEEERNGSKMWAKFSFSIILKKPNMYLITWTQTNLKPGAVNSYTVWSDGDQPYIYTEKLNTFSKLTSDEHAMRETKRYQGVIIPSLFLSVFNEHGVPFSWFKDPKVEKIEKIGEEDCYVISGTSELSKREAIWISKMSYLIKQYYKSPDYSKIHKIKIEMTDEEKERHRDSIEAIKRTKLTSFSIEINTDISFPELNKDDFNFVLPQNAVQRDKWFRD